MQRSFVLIVLLSLIGAGAYAEDSALSTRFAAAYKLNNDNLIPLVTWINAAKRQNLSPEQNELWDDGERMMFSSLADRLARSPEISMPLYAQCVKEYVHVEADPQCKPVQKFIEEWMKNGEVFLSRMEELREKGLVSEKKAFNPSDYAPLPASFASYMFIYNQLKLQWPEIIKITPNEKTANALLAYYAFRLNLQNNPTRECPQEYLAPNEKSCNAPGVQANMQNIAHDFSHYFGL